MDVVSSSYLPGDQHLVDKIVYELKSQGIFDQFRRECFSDVDTKPAYQNLRQRVEGTVAKFLKDQSWRPDMNKNQVREMLRRSVIDSGFLETGVERIVDQVVNPKINTVFLPKVEEVFYSFLGLKKPNKNESPMDLLPEDLEAVSPESETMEKSLEKSADSSQDMDESNKTEEDESPPFEPLEEQPAYVAHEENSIDSHLSAFSASHGSNHSHENKVIELDSQMSRNSSDSRLSIVTSDENSKMDLGEESQSKMIQPKSSELHKSRSDKDRKSTKDSKSRHSSSSSKDKRDRKDSRTSSRSEKDSRTSSRSEKDRKSSSSTHKSSSRDKNRKDSSSKDKERSRSSHKDSKSSRSKEKSSSQDRHKHSSSYSSSHKKDKDKKKDSKSKDDHYSCKDKKGDRRSTDRDSNDGQSSRSNDRRSHNVESSSSHKTSQENNENSATETTEHTTKAPIFISETIQQSEVSLETHKLKVLKPKCASNIQEALRLIKIRKQLAKLEKQNQLGLVSVDVSAPILQSSSIDLAEIKENGDLLNADEKSKQSELNSKMAEDMEVVPSPLHDTIISQNSWDEMEKKLREKVCGEFEGSDEDCRFFEEVDVEKNEFIQFVNGLPFKEEAGKRKLEDTDAKNNNKKEFEVVKKKKTATKKPHLEEKFSLPLSPAESDNSVDKKEDTGTPLRTKRVNSANKVNNQRYSSDDLYKPRPTFASSRRRGAKNLDN